ETPSSLTDPCRKHFMATVSGGITVNAMHYTDPTHLTLNISTVGATVGSHTVTITNPDGQTAAGAVLTTVAAASLSESPTTVNPGGSVTATWNGIANPTANDWIGLFATGTSDGSVLGWRGTTGAASGSVPFNIGGVSSGTYELRLFANNTLAKLATSSSFTVAGATLSESPSPVNPGATVTATWSGINSPSSGDWIGLYAVAAPDNSPLAW